MLRRIEHMDLEQIANSGQCFRMKKIKESTWSVVFGDKYLEISQDGDEFSFSCSEEEFCKVWHDYLDLDLDYGKIKALQDPADSYLLAAMEYGWGIRILKQNLWEMIVTFLISQNNNITRIRNSVEALCVRFGTKLVSSGGAVFYTFPQPETIVKAGMTGLSGLGLGYRDKYILKTAVSAVEKSLDLDWLKTASYEDAHKLLMAQYGIGKKVADCICLFGLYHVDAFPLDTHMNKILETHYPAGFPYGRYRGYLGIIQQYLFYYDLKPAASG